ncbi:MAG: SDR family oxidoreductase, partial [Nitrospirales bacterium]|nr:SDR family oxidoreductase [Nitrospirales bacterium]
RAFLESGYRVVLHYHSSGASLPGLIGAMEGRVLPLKADVRSSGEVAAMAQEVFRRWGRVDVLVNNAGIVRDSLLVRQREEEWDAVLAVNCKGAFNTIRAFAPLMTEGGHIVNISSYSGLKGKEGQAAYSASKAALLGLTKTAAVELAGRGIQVNAVLPGYLPTAMGSGAAGAMEKAREDSLLHVLSDPEEAARFIVHIAGMRTLTGQVFCLDTRIV